MKKTILGDTIRFITTVNDEDGTSITNAEVNLDVIDSGGSTVLSEAISHDTDGTYTEFKATDGWALGPIRQLWTVKTSGGTKSNIIDNQVKIVNAGTAFPTYVFVDELESYFPAITDYLDNKSEDHVIAAYKYENRLIDSLGYVTPRLKNDDGFFDQSVRDYNAWESIYRIVKSNQINQVVADEAGAFWIDAFKNNAMDVYKDWRSRKITFKDKISPSEGGILPPTKVSGTSPGTLFNNFEEQYGSGFRGADFKREWSVTIIGTGTNGELRDCTYTWSNDGGLGTANGTTSDEWIHLQDQVYVRFSRGTHTGTFNIFEVDDKWTWNTNPVKNQVGGRDIAVGY